MKICCCIWYTWTSTIVRRDPEFYISLIRIWQVRPWIPDYTAGVFRRVKASYISRYGSIIPACSWIIRVVTIYTQSSIFTVWKNIIDRYVSTHYPRYVSNSHRWWDIWWCKCMLNWTYYSIAINIPNIGYGYYNRSWWQCLAWWKNQYRCTIATRTCSYFYIIYCPIIST